MPIKATTVASSCSTAVIAKVRSKIASVPSRSARFEPITSVGAPVPVPCVPTAARSRPTSPSTSTPGAAYSASDESAGSSQAAR